MKKSFPLEVQDHKPPRVIEAIKGEVRKYVKRERRKPLPKGVDFWDFDCRVGPDEATAETAHVAELTERIELAAKEEGPAVYIEILAKPGHRTRKPPAEPKDDEPSDNVDSEDVSEPD